MRSLIEQYGVGLLVLIFITIMIAFSGSMESTVKGFLHSDVQSLTNKQNDDTRPPEPKNVVTSIYCILYDNGELVISQNEITPESGKTVINKGYFTKPRDIDTTEGKTHIQTVRFEGAVKPKNCYYWFYDCQNLTEIKNLENLYTDECINMEYMFANNYSLIELNVNYFNTKKVTDMGGMFEGCTSLQSLDLRNFDTKNVTEMWFMFSRCNSLTSLKIGNWDTSNVRSMCSMFNYCSKLKKIDLRSFDTKNVTCFDRMFYNTPKLQEIIIGENWDTSNGTKTELYTNCGVNTF